jgi:hypothetical protein
MASAFVQTNGRVIAGEGDPTGGDALVTNLSLFPENSLYINNNTGKLWVRNAEAGVVGDWVGASGGSGDSLFPTTGTGTATGNVIGDLDGFSLQVTKGGTQFLNIETATDAEAVLLRAINATGGGNVALFEGSTGVASAQSTFKSEFNGADLAQIQATASSGVSSIVHTADNHTFNVGVGGTFQVADGTGQYISVSTGDNGVQLSNNTATKVIVVNDDIDGISLSVGSGATRIKLDESDNSITHTADTHTFNAGGEENARVSLGTSFIRGFNPTDNDNYANLTADVDETTAKALIVSNFNDGVKSTLIECFSDATTSSITHTAEHHNFNLQDFANNAAAVGGGLVSGDLYFTNTAGEGIVKIVI